MRVGLNVEAKELPAALANFPAMATARVFGPPGSGIPTWTSPTVTALRKAGVVPWISFKDWTSDTAASAALRTWMVIPDDVTLTYLTYHHEPQGDLNPNEYRRRWRIVADVVRAHRNAARVKLVPIDVLYPSRRKIWDRYRTDWTQWTGIWQQWAPTDRAGRYLGDYMGWDCYLEITATTYERPERFFATPIGAAHTLGVPLVIPELGAIRVPSDDSGMQRAAWINNCLLYLAAQDCRLVNWWHATGTNGKDYRLTDTPSADAWRNAIALHND